jgi:formylglycine-generating enzyme required for sulfatase activity
MKIRLAVVVASLAVLAAWVFARPGPAASGTAGKAKKDGASGASAKGSADKASKGSAAVTGGKSNLTAAKGTAGKASKGGASLTGDSGTAGKASRGTAGGTGGGTGGGGGGGTGTFITVDVGNSVFMTFRRMSPGTFIIGQDPNPLLIEPNSHPVTLTKDYYIGITEVTQRQYVQIMGTNPSSHLIYAKDPNRSLDLPVDSVSWNTAVAFCTQISQRLSGKYRLPTEAEWEYACRAGTITSFYWGDPNLIGRYAWYSGNSTNQTHVVGAVKLADANDNKISNSFGMYDVAGNMEEWCSDWFAPYANVPATDPQGPATGTTKVVRGGAYYLPPVWCRSASRWGYAPASGFTYTGFRIVLEPG